MQTTPLLLAFYGDDFTGSTDALEFLSRAGADALLFIEAPTPAQLAKYPGLQAIGVAGNSRSLAPADMETILRRSFTALKQLPVKHVHYKVCSTFDSSPAVGSIGKAIDTGAEIFPNPFVPVLAAAPALGRYTVFGNHFAQMGIGSQGAIYRLDRHPSMRSHPVTPADESDLRLHLGRQTRRSIGLLNILDIEKKQEEMQQQIDQQIAGGCAVLLIDALYERQLEKIGRLIDAQVRKDRPLFSVGSSGIEMALGKYWQEQKIVQARNTWPDPGKAEPLLVISGSCSPVTEAQIEWARTKGFAEIVLPARELCETTDVSEYIADTVAAALPVVASGTSLILHTNGKAKGRQPLSSEKLGTFLGHVTDTLLQQAAVKRLVISGGDTSSYAARALGIEAVKMIAPLVAGAPLCKAFAAGRRIDGLEVNFKGGQVGAENYFGIVRDGK